jgi:hypothetical protein
MPIYAIIDNGIVTNRIELSDDAQWQPEEGQLVVEEGYEPYAIGGSYVDGVYTAPPQEASVAPQVSSVTPRQARLALLAAGLLPQVETAVNAAGGATKITWEYATIINRSDALIENIGTALGLTDAAIDLLFTQAAAIE